MRTSYPLVSPAMPGWVWRTSSRADERQEGVTLPDWTRMPLCSCSCSCSCRVRDLAHGRPARDLQDYSALAVRQGARRCDALAGFGAGYLADATHLRRRDRRAHVRVAVETGLGPRAVLAAALPVKELVERNLRRPLDERVPVDALLRQAHRRSLLSPEVLLGEGFESVVEPGGRPGWIPG